MRKINMMAFQQRVLDEKTELSLKIDKLGVFVTTDVFLVLPDIEQYRLKTQLLVMKLYEGILRDRIAAFG
jgi:hypothetical protein